MGMCLLEAWFARGGTLGRDIGGQIEGKLRFGSTLRTCSHHTHTHIHTQWFPHPTQRPSNFIKNTKVSPNRPLEFCIISRAAYCDPPQAET